MMMKLVLRLKIKKMIQNRSLSNFVLSNNGKRSVKPLTARLLLLNSKLSQKEKKLRIKFFPIEVT